MHRPVLLGAVLLLAGCGDTLDGGEDATAAMVLETCAPGADPTEVAVCECAYDGLRERFDVEELERLDRQLRDDPETVPAEVREVVLACGFEQVAPPTTKPPVSSTTTTSSTPGTADSSTSTSTSTSTTAAAP